MLFFFCPKDVVEEYYSPRKNAEEFLVALFKYRSKEHMLNFMEFIVEKLNTYNNTTPPKSRNFSEKYAALSVLSCLSKQLKKNEVCTATIF